MNIYVFYQCLERKHKEKKHYRLYQLCIRNWDSFYYSNAAGVLLQPFVSRFSKYQVRNLNTILIVQVEIYNW